MALVRAVYKAAESLGLRCSYHSHSPLSDLVGEIDRLRVENEKLRQERDEAVDAYAAFRKG